MPATPSPSTMPATPSTMPATPVIKPPTSSWMAAESSTKYAESSTTYAESSAASTLVDKPRCTHYIPCHCPSLREYASPPLGDESSPLWLQRPHRDEDHNKDLAKSMEDDRLPLKTACYNLGIECCKLCFICCIAGLAIKTGRPSAPLTTPPKVRWFRWLISADLVPRGYEQGQAPWRMLIRTYLKDLPLQLNQVFSQESVFAWQKFPRYVGLLQDRTELDDAPPEITCGRRAVFSRYNKDSNHTLVGDWLVIVYIWATDRTGAHRHKFQESISHDSVTGIRAWEFVTAVDAPTKVPHLFYQCQRRDSVEQDTVYAGHPYQYYNSVPMKPGDPVPARLAGLRRLMNGRARHLYCAPYEYEGCGGSHW